MSAFSEALSSTGSFLKGALKSTLAAGVIGAIAGAAIVGGLSLIPAISAVLPEALGSIVPGLGMLAESGGIYVAASGALLGAAAAAIPASVLGGLREVAVDTTQANLQQIVPQVQKVAMASYQQGMTEGKALQQQEAQVSTKFRDKIMAERASQALQKGAPTRA